MPSTQSTRSRRSLLSPTVAAGLASIAIVVVCMVVVRRGTVSDIEEAVFDFINGWPDFLEPPLFVVQLLGLLVLPLLAAAVALLRRRYRLAVALAALAPLKLVVEKGIIKNLVERQRPGTSLQDAILRGDVPVEGLSFPSGHAIIAFGLAVLIAPHAKRRWWPYIFGLAVLIGVARIYLGAHLPLDVVAGGAAGAALGLALAAATRSAPGH